MLRASPHANKRANPWGLDVGDATVLHVDMDSFYASVEIAENPNLANVPLIVGGSSMRGVVTSCTYDLRARGVRAGMPMSQAKRLAPHAETVPGDRTLYKRYSRRVMEILSSITPDVEPVSIDEAYLDVSGAKLRLGLPTKIAALIRTSIFEQLKLPASVGIGANKTVAKIASGHAKPNGVLVVPANQTVPFLHSLPAGALPGVGPKAQEKLREWGLDTVEDLVTAGFAGLSRILGDASAHDLIQKANGNDPRRVGPPSREKSISTEKTFSENLTTREAVERYLLEASHECAHRLRDVHLVAWTVQIKLRDGDFRTITRAHTLQVPTDLAGDVFGAARELFGAERLPRGGVRLVGVGVSGLQSRDGGIPVTLDDDPKKREAEIAMDRVHSKYGTVSLQPASLLPPTR